MPKLRVDLYNPHPNTSALMSGAAAGLGIGALSAGLAAGSFVTGVIIGDNIGQGLSKPIADHLTGTDGNDIIQGMDLNDTLEGGAGDDQLSGDLGNDRLWGGVGNDTLMGYGGNDSALGEDGDDLLIGGDDDDGLSGGTGNDFIHGDAGSDYLEGNEGNDHLKGDGGNDVLNGGAGYDVAEFLLATGSVRINLNKTSSQNTGQGYDQLISIEFVMSGSGNDTLIGNRGNNTFTAWLGKDKLYGKLGNDALWGFAGADKFIFDTKLNKKKNIDWLYDFNRKEKDKIVLDNDIFKGLKAGKLKKSAFHIGSKAKDAEDRILYNKAVKALAYDPDGNGPKAATMFAKFPGKESLTYGDFLVIG